MTSVVGICPLDVQDEHSHSPHGRQEEGRSLFDRNHVSSDDRISDGSETSVASRRIRGVALYDAMKAWQRLQPATCPSTSATVVAGNRPSRYSISRPTPVAHVTSLMIGLR